MVAVSVQLTDPARVGSFVTPGTQIAIFDSYKIKAIGDDAKSKALNDARGQRTSVLLDDVLVIAMGDAALNPGTQAARPREDKDAAAAAAASASLVTVAVTPTNAARLIHGINRHPVRRTPQRGPQDGRRPAGGRSLNLFDLSGLGK